jgi:hypothetical protein
LDVNLANFVATTLEAGVASYVRDVLLRAEDPFA